MKLSSPNRLLLICLAIPALAIICPAASNTWVGTTNSWDTGAAANWTSPTTWTSGDDAVFGTAGDGGLTLALTTVTAHNLTFNTTGYSLAGTTLTLNGTAPTITTASSVSASISSVIDGTAGFVKTGAGTLTLTGANTYSGGTTLTDGLLYLGGSSGTALGIGDLIFNLSSNVTTNLKGVYLDTDQVIGVTHFTSGNLGYIRPNGHNLTVAGLDSTAVFGVIENGGSGKNVSADGSVTIDVASGASYAYAGISRDADANGGTGKLGFIKNGLGSQTFRGSNFTQTGGITVNAGTLIFDGTAGFGTGGITVNGGTLSFTGNTTWDRSKINSQAMVVNHGGMLLINGGGTFHTKVTDTIDVNGGGVLKYVGGTTQDWANLVGIINLSSANGTGATVSTADGSAVRFAQGGNGTVTSTGTVANTFSANISLTKTDANRTFTVNAAAGNTLNITGGIKDYSTKAGTPVVFNGAGTVILAGANTYSGTTTINNGTLFANGTHTGSGAFTVATTATLGGTGSLIAAVTASGILAPGTTGVGTLNTGAVSLTGTYACQVEDPVCDLLAVTGNLILTDAELAITGTLTRPNYVIATYTGMLFGVFKAPSLTGYTVDYGTGTNSVIKLVKNTGYSLWKDAWLTNGFSGDSSVGADPDGDGMTNLVEYVLNGDLSVPDRTILPQPQVTATDFVFTFTRRVDSAADTAQLFEYSSDLTLWTPVNITGTLGAEVSNGSITGSVPNQVQGVTVTIPRSAAINGKLFGRLRLTQDGPSLPAAESPPTGGFISPGVVASITTQADTAPMFGQWQIGISSSPIVGRFSARPNTAYQVFIGLNEAYWDRSGQRLMDIEINGVIVSTVDSFHLAKNTPSGYLFSATTDPSGHLIVRILPHPGAPDQNTIICGMMLFGADQLLVVDEIIHNRAPLPLVSVLAGQIEPQKDSFASASFVNHRVDNDMVAGMGTCYLNDFRFFTMLHQDAWDQLRWETLGNAVMAHRTWRNWPYEQHLKVQVDGVELTEDSAIAEQVEQQFDYRIVNVSSPSLKIERLDMMRSARQWTTALHLTNLKDTPVTIVVSSDWSGKYSVPIDVRTWADGETNGFAYSLNSGPPTLVALGSGGSWEKQGLTSVRSRWEVVLGPRASTTVPMDVHIGWAAMPTYKDTGLGTVATDGQATLDRRADIEGFRTVAASLGVNAVTTDWPNLMQLCEARRHYVYDRMPRLTGFDPEWEGMWSYAFDLMRSAICPPQANFQDVWMVCSLDVYREPFYWDGPATMHTFCNWDADLAARMMRTFWSSMKSDGTVCVSANPYRVFNNPTPQLANLTMALWDCYQITRDQQMLASFYPEIVKHVRWIETTRNATPNGPLMDIGYNIDYGPPGLYASPTIWPDVQFFLVDRYRYLAKIATVLGKAQSEVDEWTGKANALAEAIRNHMWDDTAGTFWCVSDTLAFKPVPSPIEFHGMIADVPTRAQAARLMERLRDPAKYAPTVDHPYGLPSAPFDSPYFVVKDSWSGTIWPIQTYYTVRGLVNYGYQNDAAALSANLYGMMARDYRKTGSIWEQYDPISGQDLSNLPSAMTGSDSSRGYFTSGITTSVLDMLLRGTLGFARTDDANAFYLTPTPLKDDWHGVTNLPLSGKTQLSIQIRDEGETTACKVKFSGLDAASKSVTIHLISPQDGTRREIKRVSLDDQNEVTVSLGRIPGTRYLWEVR